MKRIGSLVLIVAFGIVLSQSVSAQSAKSWNIDKSHSSIAFSIDHFFSAVPGKFKDFGGTIHFDPDNLKGSSVDFIIQVKSVDTDEADRDSHLQSPDFFDAATYPVITFKSQSFTKTSENMYVVKGTLTMRGTSKEVELPLKVKGTVDNPWKEGSVIMGISIDTALDRTDYGVGTGSWGATAVVGDEVIIRINMELDAPK